VHYKLISHVLLAVIISTLISACQPLERPFQPEAKARLQATAGPRASLYIAPINNGNEEMSAILAKLLQDLGIAAFSGEAQPNVYQIKSSIFLKEGSSFITWRVIDPYGAETQLETTQEIGTITNGPTFSSPDLKQIFLKSASEIDIMLGGAGTNFASLEKPVLFVPIVQNAPGDGSETLSAAMQSQFVKYGFDVLPEQWGATYFIKGEVSLTEPKGNSQIVSILWKLERPNGEFVGKVEQRNRIRAGTLNGPWGPVAIAAAKGGARGILKLLRQVEPGYFGKKS